jgi:hypothetical protein
MGFSCDKTDCWYQAVGQVGVCENKTGGGCPLTYPLVANCVEQTPTVEVGSATQASGLYVSESRRPGGTTVADLSVVLGLSPDTVKDAIRCLYPGLMVSGRKTYLNTEQVATVLARRRRLDESRRATSRGAGTARI